MQLPDLAAVDEAAALVHRHFGPTPQYAWPLLAARTGCAVWVKHENHTPIGAFKLRGGLVHLARLKQRGAGTRGLISATRGNHGQSLALAARLFGMHATIVVPEGNSREKNAAMRAFGATLIETGRDFEDARQAAVRIADERGLSVVPSFHTDLVCGVATYAREFFAAVPDLHTVYCPIGLGSGICGLIRVRDLLGLATRIVGVVAAGAPCYALSFAAGRAVETRDAITVADGMACRVPAPEALDVILRGAERIVTVDDAQIEAAMRVYYTDTHNLAEGAGAAALAALLSEAERQRGRKIGLVLSGGNVDREVFARVLGGS